MDIIEMVGWAASAATIATYAMKTMLPLRITAIASSLFFIVYALGLGLWPLLAMELILLPFNLWRTLEILQLRKRVREMRHTGQPDFSVLKRHSRPTHFASGSTLFRRGEAPNALYFVETGEVVLEEFGITLGPGEILGEIAFFIDAEARTATARCTADSRVHVIDEASFLRLYFQDPAFGMAIMKTITRRLIESVEKRPDVFKHGAPGPAAAGISA